MPRTHPKVAAFTIPVLLALAGTTAKAAFSEGDYRAIACPASFTIRLDSVKDGKLEIWGSDVEGSLLATLSDRGSSYEVKDSKANIKFTGKFEANVEIWPKLGPAYQFSCKPKTLLGIVKGYEVTDGGWNGAMGPWKASFKADNVTKVEKKLMGGMVASGGGIFLELSK